MSRAVTKNYPMGAPRGGKQIYLPNFVLTLLRTPKLPPTFATFIVPLNFNKLDLRDYLYHGYNIKVNAVRSYIQQQKIRQGRPGDARPPPRQWMRPRSIKKMTVEMQQPFRWPSEPENYDAWDQERFKAAGEDRDQAQEPFKDPRAWRTTPTRERISIAEQALEAQGLLAQQRHVRRLHDKQKRLERLEKQIKADSEGWEDVGDAIEVEVDVKTSDIPKLGEFTEITQEKTPDIRSGGSLDVLNEDEPIVEEAVGHKPLPARTRKQIVPESSPQQDWRVATHKKAYDETGREETRALGSLIEREEEKLERLMKGEKPIEEEKPAKD